MDRLLVAWQDVVFEFYLAEEKIEPEVVENMRSWEHSRMWQASTPRAPLDVDGLDLELDAAVSDNSIAFLDPADKVAVAVFAHTHALNSGFMEFFRGRLVEIKIPVSYRSVRLLGPGHLILGDDLAYLTFVGIR